MDSCKALLLLTRHWPSWELRFSPPAPSSLAVPPPAAQSELDREMRRDSTPLVIWEPSCYVTLTLNSSCVQAAQALEGWRKLVHIPLFYPILLSRAWRVIVMWSHLYPLIGWLAHRPAPPICRAVQIEWDQCVHSDDGREGGGEVDRPVPSREGLHSLSGGTTDREVTPQHARCLFSL